MTTFDAIIPAGGSIDPEFAARVGTTSKALIPLDGVTILRRTIEALRETGRVQRVVVVGSPEVLGHADSALADERVEAGTSGPDTIMRGLKHLAAKPNPPQKVLIVTADLPFVTGDVFRRFLDLCPTDRDVCVPLITKTEYQERFPGSGATFVPLKDETWTAGCAYVMSVAAFQKALPRLERLFQNRKSKVGMIKLLGFGFLIKFVTKSLTIKDIEKKVGHILNASGAPVLRAPAELAYDIDFLDDYEFALQHLSESHARVQ